MVHPTHTLDLETTPGSQNLHRNSSLHVRLPTVDATAPTPTMQLAPQSVELLPQAAKAWVVFGSCADDAMMIYAHVSFDRSCSREPLKHMATAPG